MYFILDAITQTIMLINQATELALRGKCGNPHKVTSYHSITFKLLKTEKPTESLLFLSKKVNQIEAI